MAVGDIILLVLLVIVSVKQNLKLTTISFTVPPPVPPTCVLSDAFGVSGSWFYRQFAAILIDVPTKQAGYLTGCVT